MRLLLDQNLSPRLVERLDDLYPDSIHVSKAGLDRATDRAVWEHHLLIVSKDADFNELSVLWGTPPQVIWIRRGNCSTAEIETTLRDNYQAIRDFAEDMEAGTLVLF